MSNDVTDQIVQEAKGKNAAKNVKLIYILYLVSLLIGLTSIIGVIMAYVNKGDAPEWAQSHYRFQIRTFWIGLVMALIGMITTAFFIGIFILLFWLVWFIIRNVKGMKSAGEEQPYPNVEGWLW
ncbi:MAG: hypothetical protein MI743_11385 [Sneathiellales bacterium]|nr:hypothetical protein [Sneathiellales bacterium]